MGVLGGLSDRNSGGRVIFGVTLVMTVIVRACLELLVELLQRAIV